jgi:hypothetical protein
MKEIDWAPITGYTVFCDDIRAEVTGKVTLVGTYNDAINVASDKPVNLPKLCASITYTEKAGLERPDKYELLVFFPGNDTEPQMRAPITLPESGNDPEVAIEKGHRMILKINLELAPFPAQNGFLRIRMLRGGEMVRLGSLKVNLAPPTEPADATA